LIRKKLKEISDRVVPGAYGVKMGDDEKINRLLNLLTFIYKFDTKVRFSSSQMLILFDFWDMTGQSHLESAI
jgi:hypothetical protein